MDTPALHAISPIDGRYAKATDALRAYASEAALIRERIRVEALWALQLAELGAALPAAHYSAPVRACLEQLAVAPPADAATAIKTIEQRINHDVKAVEYYLRDRLHAAGASAAALELIHFGCTSEDINNLSYARLLRDARAQVLLPAIDALSATLRAMAAEHASLAMMSRTHGQPASPTTLGKELANVGARLQSARRRMADVAICGKWNGAVGNYNAHHAALPAVDWIGLSQRFVESQHLQWNAWSTQIEPHDWIAAYCDALAAINTILIDFSRDVWGYISLGYLRQRPVAGEVGSSTMPHKINPIDFENAEGNFGLANALLRHFSDKLPISRWQRDLTDSTVLRNLGVALAHALIGWQALARGLGKVAPDPARMRADLQLAWEVLTEAVQTALRAAGVAGGYELLKDFSRGQAVDAARMRAFVATLPLPAEQRERLAALNPEEYTGLAAELALRYCRQAT